MEKCPEAQRLATHPGVGPLTAMAFVLIIGEAERFQCGKQVASYLGLVPMEESSGNQRRSGTHHQARQFDIALPAGGGGAGNSAQSSGMAQPILSPDDAAGTEDRQGRHGAATGCLSVLDDAPGMGLSAVDRVRFARGAARKSPWCAVEHRVIEWAPRSSSSEEFELVIMIAVATEEMHGSDRVLT